MNIQHKKSNTRLTFIIILFLVALVQLNPAHAATCGGLPAQGDVPAGVYDFPPGCVHTLTDTLYIVTGATVTINGNGGTIEGDNTFQLLQITGNANLNLDNVTVTKGSYSSGGAVFVGPTCTVNITGSTFTGNASPDSGGAIGIGASDSILNITNSTFSNNTAGTEGGALAVYSGTVNINSSSFLENSGSFGGAVYNSSSLLTIDSSTFTNNISSGGGGAIATIDTVNITDSTFTGNQASNGGAIITGGLVTVTNSTISNNTVSGAGGAIYNVGGTVTISDSAISGNAAAGAGAILNGNTLTDIATLTITRSAIINNSATAGGGAITTNGVVTIEDCSIIQGNTGGVPDGIYNDSVAATQLTISNSSIYNTVQNVSALGTINADGNWWGDLSGPGGLAVGFTVNSWLLAPACTSPGYASTPVTPGGAIDLGSASLGTPTDYTLTVQETGDNALVVSQPAGGFFSGAHPGDFSIVSPAFPFTINDGGADQPVVISCTPSAAGTRTATLSFNTNDPAQPTVTYNLACTEASTTPVYAPDPTPDKRCTILVVFDSNPPHDAINPERWGLPQMDGELRFFTGFSYETTYFRPEGRLEDRLPVIAGQRTNGTVEVACGQHVRAWLFDQTGALVGFVPSQYENGDGVLVPWSEDYGSGEIDSPYAQPVYNGRYGEIIAAYGEGIEAILAKLDGEIVQNEIGGSVEWGLVQPGQEYIPLGWSWQNEDGSIGCSIPDAQEKRPRLLTLEEFCVLAQMHD